MGKLIESRRSRVQIIVPVLILLFLGAGGVAYSAEVERPCAEEIAKYCKDVKAGGGRILSCLHEHQKDLSINCSKKLEESKQKIMEAQQACSGDLEKFCKDVQPGQGRLVEPQAPTVSKRFETMRILSEAGIHTGISVAPIIPGLNEEAIPELLSRAKSAGATSATCSLLRLPGHVETVFLDRMREALPYRISKIIHRLQEVRGGKLSESGFFGRHHGNGTYWRCVEQLFELGRRRAGFVEDDRPFPGTFRRPTAQQSLFD